MDQQTVQSRSEKNGDFFQKKQLFNTKLLPIIVVLALCLGQFSVFSQGVWLSTFEKKLVEQGRWHQYGNCKISKDKGCLKVTFGGCSKHPYAAIGFAKLNQKHWTKNDQIVFRFKGDGSDNIVCLSVATNNKTWTWKKTMSTALAEWQVIRAPLKEFVNPRDNGQKLLPSDYPDIRYLTWGLQSGGEVKFPVQQSFSFYLDDIAIVPQNESFPIKISKL